MSPAVDLGQIEGGYIMGQGHWTTEKVVHDENTGKMLTNGTWVFTKLIKCFLDFLCIIIKWSWLCTGL